MINTLISILIVKGILGEAEGKALAEKISLSTLPADFDSAYKQVKNFIATIAKDV